MEIERGVVEPRRVVPCELHDAGLHHETEEKTPQQPASDFLRGSLAPPLRAERPRKPCGGERRGFEQERVPLEIGERAADAHQRKIERPADERAHAGAEAGSERDGEERAEPALGEQPRVAVAEPAERGMLDGAEHFRFLRREQLFAHGQQSVFAD